MSSHSGEVTHSPKDKPRVEKVVRYVVVNRWAPPNDDLRVLTFPAQGRHTFATRALAEAALDAMRPGLDRVIGERVATLEVLAVYCYAGHHDPCGTVYGDDYVEPKGAAERLWPFTRCEECSAYGRWPVRTKSMLAWCTGCWPARHEAALAALHGG